MDTKKLTLAVAIPSYRGAHKLRPLLDALAVQTVQPLAVVVTYQPGLDDTDAVLAEYTGRLPLHPDPQPNRSRGTTRNNAARAAAALGADVILFFDDDMLPAADCVARHLAHHAAHPGSMLCGTAGQAVLENDVQRYKLWLEGVWLAAYGPGLCAMKRGSGFTSAHFSVPTALFWQLGGFDERINDGEDFEFGLRADDARVVLYFDRSVQAGHRDPINLRTLILRRRDYVRQNQLLNQLRPEIAREFANRTLVPSPAKRLLHWPFSWRLWLYLADRTRLLTLLPRPLRYRLYTTIVSALSYYFPGKKI